MGESLSYSFTAVLSVLLLLGFYLSERGLNATARFMTMCKRVLIKSQQKRRGRKKRRRRRRRRKRRRSRRR